MALPVDNFPRRKTYEQYNKSFQHITFLFFYETKMENVHEWRKYTL